MNWERINELRDEIGEEDLVDVLNLFLEEVQEKLDTLETDDTSQFASDLHFVKSSALNIGFQTFAEMSAKMESASRRGEKSLDINLLKESFLRSSKELKEGIKNWRV